MENKLIKIIYEELKDKNLYKYDNDEELKNAQLNIYTNLLGELVIDVTLEHEVFTIHCFKSYADKEAK